VPSKPKIHSTTKIDSPASTRLPHGLVRQDTPSATASASPSHHSATIAVNLLNASFVTERFSIDGPSSRRQSLVEEELLQCRRYSETGSTGATPHRPTDYESNPLGGLPHLPHPLSADNDNNTDLEVTFRCVLVPTGTRRQERLSERTELGPKEPPSGQHWPEVINSLEGDSPSPAVRCQSSVHSSCSDHSCAKGRRAYPAAQEEQQSINDELYREVIASVENKHFADSPIEERRSPGFYTLEPADTRWWEPHIRAGGYNLDD
jgi:hypothetical protein